MLDGISFSVNSVRTDCRQWREVAAVGLLLDGDWISAIWRWLIFGRYVRNRLSGTGRRGAVGAAGECRPR